MQTAETLSAAGFYDETVVTIDVKPDTFPNIVSAGQNERLQVAILSTAGFDATDIVPGSLRLASATMFGAAANPGGTNAHDADVNGDGRTDLLVEFRLDRLTLDPDDIIVDLWGRTRGGNALTGTDLVQIVP